MEQQENNQLIDYFLSLAKKYNINQQKIYKKYDEDYDKIDELTDDFHNKNKPTIQKKLATLQNKKVDDFENSGIINKKLDSTLSKDLLKSINKFADSIKPDYHPGSNNRILNIVHPSIYPLITSIEKSDNKVDFWERPYENSKYQWLPSEFFINKDGKCKIQTYINNLPGLGNEIYQKIESLFDTVLPEFEKMWHYINNTELYNNSDDIFSHNKNKKVKYTSLRNRNIQVITKIVRIEFNSKDSLDGSWHVEGMSHENIVATASCTLEQMKDFNATLYFKRRYMLNEAQALVFNTPQNPPNGLRGLLEEGMIPLGKVPIKTGSLIVFPNSHIHKIDMSTTSEGQTRTIVVFWLINPDNRITSTKDIEQQSYDITEAHKHRLELMKERTLYKSSFNIRELNLCEH